MPQFSGFLCVYSFLFITQCGAGFPALNSSREKVQENIFAFHIHISDKYTKSHYLALSLSLKRQFQCLIETIAVSLGNFSNYYLYNHNFIYIYMSVLVILSMQLRLL